LTKILKLPDFNASRTEALINAFSKISAANQVSHTTLPETHYKGSARVGTAKLLKFFYIAK
jgi:hypothetical protein